MISVNVLLCELEFSFIWSKVITETHCCFTLMLFETLV